jgi:seryl-tRNA synthetase
MLDLKFIIENQKLVAENAKNKNIKIELDKLVELDTRRRELLQKTEELRAQQKKLGKDQIEEAKKLKQEIKALDPELDEVQKDLQTEASKVPNMILDSVPVGKSEDDNKVTETHGDKTELDFEPKDHLELGTALGILDMEKATEMSGARFYYLKGDAALLEFALIQFTMQKLNSKGFTPVIPPVLVKEKAMYATGFFPAEMNEIYSVNPGEDDLYLVGTSEVPLTMLHAQETLHEKELPIRYCGFSTCFRREAGSYGKDTRGIIRVHQFDKVEMFSFCHPGKSKEEHELIKSIEEEIMQDLGLPYQVLNICSADLGAPAAKKYDLEAWIPTQGKYRELTSCSNCTDYQARRANIKFKPETSNPETQQSKFVHTLNGTAVAMARTIVAILENYQNSDGSVTIPEVLRPFLGGKEKIERK